MPYTNIEAAKLLRTRLKPYYHIEPVMKQSTFSTTLRNIELDLSKKETVRTFFPAFGFTGAYDAWELDVEHWFLPAI